MDLVHPSNTEPIVRIITEAPTEERANELLIDMDRKNCPITGANRIIKFSIQFFSAL